jgi:hypothetical protein
MPEAEVTSDGWLVDDPWLFQKLIAQPPPRPYSYWDQMCQDARYWIIIAIWFVIVAFLVLPFITGWYLLLFPGFFLSYKWWFLWSSTVSNFRNTPIAGGIIENVVASHPLGNVVVGRPRTAVAQLSDGRNVPLTISEGMAKAAFRDSEKAEVLFLDNPRDDFPIAIGVRPIPRQYPDPSGPTAD